MSLLLEQTLTQILQGLCDNVYPDYAPSGVSEPYVVWSIYGGQALVYTDNSFPDQRNAYVQINVWHPSRATCNTLIAQIEQALLARADLQVRPVASPSTLFDEVTQRRGASQDFNIWAAR